MQVLDVELLCDFRAALGESPRWDSEAHLVRWVDIDGGWLLSVGLSGGSPTVFRAKPPLGGLVLTNHGSCLVAIGDDWCSWDGAGSPEVLWSLNRPGLRFNDGGVDRAGSLWSATMRLDERMEPPASGGLFRLDELGVSERLSGLIAGNGIAWSGDDTRLYVVDSGFGHVLSARFDPDEGVLVDDPRSMIRVVDGMPDGIATDLDGGVWVACWGSGQVVRFGPEGRATHRLVVPTPQVTAVAFAGRDLDTLIVTTAARDRPRDRKAGSLYAAASPVPGVPLHAARLPVQPQPALG